MELIFDAYDDDMTGKILMSSIKEMLEDQGLKIFDTLPFQDKESINLEQFHTLF